MRNARLETIHGKVTCLYQEDAYIISLEGDEKTFGVFDGHGG